LFDGHEGPESLSVAYDDPDHYPAVLLSTLLGGMSSRLFQEIREKRGLVYSIFSFAAPFKDGGLFGIYAGTGEREASELMPVVPAELGKVQNHITEPELSRAGAQLKASLLMSQESSSKYRGRLPFGILKCAVCRANLLPHAVADPLISDEKHGPPRARLKHRTGRGNADAAHPARRLARAFSA
jgi:hypothetical protein